MGHASEAAPFPDGAKVVHIGLPKTGTSAIQEAFHQARPALAEHGVVYAGNRRHSYKAAKSALGHSKPWIPAAAGKAWTRLARDIRESTARCTVLSSEALSGASTRSAQRIVEQLGGDVHVVVTLRALAPIVASRWQQSVRNQKATSYPEWLDKAFRGAPDPDGEAAHFWRRFDIPLVLRTWADAVGEDRITFVIPDPADRQMLYRTFEELTSLPEGTLLPGPRGNESLPFPEVELLRHFNLVFARAGGSRELWMRTVGRGRRRIKEMRTPLQPHPIVVPRWAAEAANEASRPWVEALHASVARVVGDPDHLLVDPARYPESFEVPATVSVDSAGELAHILYLSGLDYVPRSKRAGRARPARPRRAPARPVSLAGVPSRDLVTELRRRTVRRLRRR